MQRLLLVALFALSMAQPCFGGNLRSRELQTAPYFQTSDLGELNLEAASGNPLKGLFGGKRWKYGPLPEKIPLSLEWYNLGLDEIMVGDNAFDWTMLDEFLEGSASRNKHVVFSVFIHWPGKPLRLPPHLANIQLYPTDEEHGPSPNYGDPILLTALEQFIAALGKRYDGDKRIAAIHLGLLGYWGEFRKYRSATMNSFTRDHYSVPVSHYPTLHDFPRHCAL